MNTRKSRIGLIADMIRKGKVGSQEQLQQLLSAEGVTVTQATLSRDLRQLGATRRPDADGKAYYYLPEDEMPSEDAAIELPLAVSGQRERFGNALLSAAISRNMVVLKTRPGYASGLAVEIDMIGSPYVLGTIAGGDTVMMVMHDALSKNQIKQLLATFIPLAIINSTEKLSTGSINND